MISFLMGSAIGLTALQAGIDLPRKNLSACLRTTIDAARSQNISASDYAVFALKACDSQANSLMSGLVGFDVKNGVRRTQASADAKAQIDDYLAVSSEKYEAIAGKPKMAAATSPAAVVTPAAAPKP